ncbi:hypothetical protein CsSME_00015492 [Camellia sinensis var. sinensis]
MLNYTLPFYVWSLSYFSFKYNTAEACPLYCLEADYMICESSGNQRFSPACNCCLAGKGCTIYFNDRTSETC